jgi:hypothetical protein
MTPDAFKHFEQLLAEQISNQRVIAALLVFLGVIGVVVLGAYLRKKGEAYATKEGIDEQIRQLKLTTKAVEDVKTPILKEIAEKNKELAKELEDHKASLTVRLIPIQQENARLLTEHSERLKRDIALEMESVRSQIQEIAQYRAGFIGPQLVAYQSLWAKTEPVRPTRAEPLTSEDRATLNAELTRWYYEAGNGVCLSLLAGRKWMAARKTLTDSASDALVKAAFSTLRTQLKVDLHIYGPEEADSPLEAVRHDADSNVRPHSQHLPISEHP